MSKELIIKSLEKKFEKVSRIIHFFRIENISVLSNEKEKNKNKLKIKKYTNII